MQDPFDELPSKEVPIAVNESVDGLILLGSTTVKLHENGKLMEGVLACDQVADGLELAALFRVRLRADGKIERCMLKKPQLVGALRCVGGVQFFTNGLPKFATLADPHIISGVPAAAADLAALKLTPEVDLRTSSEALEYQAEHGERWIHQEGMLELTAKALEREYWKARTVEFHENGKLKFVQLGADHTVGGKQCTTGMRLEFDDAGRLTESW